jgi:DNA-binding LacI/PurR family transcriptional regulator
LKEGAKIVLIDRRLDNLNCPAVTTDNVLVGYLATEHLINLGHRRIGHLRGPDVMVGNDRFEGYRRALSKYGLKYDTTLVRECGFLEAQGYEAMRTWIAEGGVPEAIFAANDPAAIGAMSALEEAGWRVGTEIAIVGAGSIHYGEMLRVTLTTVGWSTGEMGQQAARLLIELIEEKASSHVTRPLIPPKLIVRRSSGTQLAAETVPLFGTKP